MDSSQALQILRRVRDRLEARGVAHAALFGSVARGQTNPHSDVDVLITPHQGSVLSLFDLGAIQSILEEAFQGRSVDVVVMPVRAGDMREAITRDQVHAF